MASKKATTKAAKAAKTVKAEAPKTEAKAVKVEEIKVEAPKTEVEEVKVEAPKTEEVKAEVKEEKAEAKKAPAKKPAAAKKTAAKKAEEVKTETVITLEFGEYAANMTTVEERVKAQYAAEGNDVSAIKTLNIYAKPFENAAYYVINGDVTGCVNLF